MTKDKSITIATGEDQSKHHTIRRIGKGEAHRTLGVYISANGDQMKQK